MRFVLIPLLFFSALAVANPKVKIENVKVVVTEKGKEPVTVTMPYWVAKSSASVSEKLKIGNDQIPIKEIIQILDQAPQLGTVMTVEEKGKKIVVSIE